MRRHFIFIMAVLGLGSLLSCGTSNDDITAKEIIKASNAMLVQQGADTAVANIVTGYYELNAKEGRDMLKRLEAAGLVTYDVERYAWWNTEHSTKRVLDHYDYYYYTWTGAFSHKEPVYVTKKVTDYTYDEHFMVTVELTELGQQQVLGHQPQGITKDDADMEQPHIVDSLLPENNADLSESWPEVPHPKAKEAFENCMKIIGEARQLAENATDDKGLSKSEAKLDEVELVRFVENLTSDQREEKANKYMEVSNLITTKESAWALGKCKEVIAAANELTEKATDCKGITKSENKLKEIAKVKFYDKLTQRDGSEKDNLFDDAVRRINSKKDELGCNVEEEPEEQAEEMDPQKRAYLAAKSNERSFVNIMLAYTQKAIKARNIQMIKNEASPAAKANVIYQIKKVTDAGRVLYGVAKGSKAEQEEKFTRFVDKGWVSAFDMDGNTHSQDDEDDFDLSNM